jgi:BON domain
MCSARTRGRGRPSTPPRRHLWGRRGGPRARGGDDRLERLPPDIRDLNDEEVEDYIREYLRDDGRVDAHELRITYRAGVITLEGTVPSEEQHQMVLQYVTDFARVQEVADRLVIDALAWEREDRPACGRGVLLRDPRRGHGGADRERPGEPAVRPARRAGSGRNLTGGLDVNTPLTPVETASADPHPTESRIAPSLPGSNVMARPIGRICRRESQKIPDTGGRGGEDTPWK